MKFKTTFSAFEVNIIGKTIRRIPDNISGCWKSYISISKPKLGAPVLVVWSVDDLGNPTKSTLTSSVVAYEY